MGCIADRKKPLITIRCSKRTTMPSIVEHKFLPEQEGVNMTEQHKTKCYMSSIIKENEDI